jgi:hypothetical protein
VKITSVSFVWRNQSITIHRTRPSGAGNPKSEFRNPTPMALPRSLRAISTIVVLSPSSGLRLGLRGRTCRVIRKADYKSALRSRGRKNPLSILSILSKPFGNKLAPVRKAGAPISCRPVVPRLAAPRHRHPSYIDSCESTQVLVFKLLRVLVTNSQQSAGALKSLPRTKSSHTEPRSGRFAW